MFSRLKALFTKPKVISTQNTSNIKKHSLTTTPATEGEDKLENIKPQLIPVMEKLRTRSGDLNLDDINTVLLHKYNISPIKIPLFKLQEYIAKSMVFELEGISIELTPEEEIDTFKFILKEHTYNYNLHLTLDVDTFKEIIKEIHEVKITTK